MTSAPRSASTIVAYGPASTRDRSSTRNPPSAVGPAGPGMAGQSPPRTPPTTFVAEPNPRTARPYAVPAQSGDRGRRHDTPPPGRLGEGARDATGAGGCLGLGHRG